MPGLDWFLRRDIPEPHLDGVHADGLREGVHHLFERPCPLRVAGCAEGAGGPGVDIDLCHLCGDVRTQVEVLDQSIYGAHADGIRPAGAEDRERKRRERAVTLDACLQPHGRGRPVADGEVGLFAGKEELHGSARLPAQERRDDRRLVRLQLAPESAPHVVADDPHPREGEAQHLGHLRLDRVDALGRLPYGQLTAVPSGNAAMGFHRRMELARGPVRFFQDHVRLREALCDIAPCVAFRRLDAVAPRMHLTSAGGERQGIVGDKRQHVVVHLDRAYRVPGPIRRVGRDRRHYLPLITTMGIEELEPRGRCVRPHEIGAGRRAADDRPDPLHLFRGAHVDALYHGVGVGRAEERAVEHAGKGYVGRIDRSARSGARRHRPWGDAHRRPASCPRAWAARRGRAFPVSGSLRHNNRVLSPWSTPYFSLSCRRPCRPP